MRLAAWAYPWDVLDLGIDAVAHDLRDRAGFDGINLATAYHAGRFLQPRSPRRKTYFPEDGTIYFHPEAARWEGKAIQPKVAGLLDGGADPLRELIEGRDRTGLSVACWTVAMHNFRLGQLYPEACTLNVFGEPSLFGLCPNNERVREYIVTLVADLTHNYRPDYVQLESLGFMGWAHGYHHEKDGVGLTREDDFLLSLCFCEACVARARRAGVDVDSTREFVRAWLEEAMGHAIPVQRGIEILKELPELRDYLALRAGPVTSMAERIRDAAHPDTRIFVLEDGGALWQAGCDLPGLAKVIDGAVVCAYDRSPAAAGELTIATRMALGEERHLGVGMRLFHPEMQGPEDLVAHALTVAKSGADEIDFYNYGLVPAARLDWLRDVSDAVRG